MTSHSSPDKLEAAIAAAFEKLGTDIHARHAEIGRTESGPSGKPAVAGGEPVPSLPAMNEKAIPEELAAARRRGAVLGWVDPDVLVPIEDRALKERVLSLLFAECDVDARKHRRLWRLRREPRREVLAGLLEDPKRLEETLRQTGGMDSDPAARLLRRLLRGDSFGPDRLGAMDVSTLLQVAEWAHGIVKDAPDPHEVRGQMARRAMMESFGVLLRDGFRGRREELGTLRRFVWDSPRPDSQVAVFGLSGIGGVGKSTLLARFADDLLDIPRARRPAVVMIDFDRARFASGEPIALTFELTRQIAAWFPALAAPLRGLRHRVRQNLASGGFASASQTETYALEGMTRSMSEATYLLREVLAPEQIGTFGGRPLVVVFDTFEALQGARGLDPDAGGGLERVPVTGYRGVHAVAEWAQDLCSISRLPLLKVVVAGRAPISEDPSFGPRLSQPELRLTGLDRDASRSLLRDLGLRADVAETVADALGDPEDGSGNPLVLRLAARVVGAGTVRAEDLRKEAAADRKAFDQELVQGILYRRILAHIGERDKDKGIAAIAHPGLVLRRVTPDVIEHVLAPAIELGAIGSERARELFDRLRREVWLVQDAGSDTVVHRSDLRRVMLRLIDAEARETARRIHGAARDYYGGGRDPKLAAELSAGEGLYHELMLLDETTAASIDPVRVRRYESVLYSGLDDLPPPVRAVVKSILDRPLTDTEGKALPEPQRTEFILRQGERHLLGDEPYRALALLDGTDGLHPLWELRALAVTASWTRAREAGLLAPRPPKDRTEASSPGELHDRFNLASWIWFCLGDDAQAFRCGMGLVPWLEKRPDWDSLPARLVEQLARGMTYATVAARAEGQPWPMTVGPVPWGRLGAHVLQDFSIGLEATRHAVLAGPDGPRDPVIVVSGESAPLSLRLLDALQEAGFPEAISQTLGTLRQELATAGERSSSGQIHGLVARTLSSPHLISAKGEPHPSCRALCPNPEFRGPAKFAILEAVLERRELRRVAEIAWDLIDVRPLDLQPDAFARNAVRGGKTGSEVANLVLYLDRCMALGPFLRAVRSEWPAAEKLRSVSDAFERWDRAFSDRPAPTAAGVR